MNPTVPADLVDKVVPADGGGRSSAEAVLGEHLQHECFNLGHAPSLYLKLQKLNLSERHCVH